jgi:hypothetical protein
MDSLDRFMIAFIVYFAISLPICLYTPFYIVMPIVGFGVGIFIARWILEEKA